MLSLVPRAFKGPERNEVWFLPVAVKAWTRGARVCDTSLDRAAHLLHHFCIAITHQQCIPGLFEAWAKLSLS